MQWEVLFGQVVTRIAQGFRGDDKASQFYMESLGRLGRHMVGSWGGVTATGMVCACRSIRNPKRPCPLPAAGPCLHCNKLVCIAHAMVTPQTPALLCAECVKEAFPEAGAIWRQDARDRQDAAERGEDRSEDALRKKHLETLGLDELATIEEIREAQRKAAKRYHPDRQRDVRRRTIAERAMKAVNEAAAWLIAHEEAAA